MAEGPLGSVASDLRNALPSLSVSHAGVEKKQQQPPAKSSSSSLQLKVLSWNIFGPTDQGRAARRNRLVPGVVNVEPLTPDVLLLQETRTQRLLDLIAEAGNGQYIPVPAHDPNESQVLYNPENYDTITGQRIFPAENGLQNLQDALDASIQEFLNEGELEDEDRETLEDNFTDRLSHVGLKRKGDKLVPENVIIFMSFHNVYKDPDTRDRAAKGLCRIVHILQERTAAVVLAGADMNQPIAPEEVVLEYVPTERRRRIGRVIDYILASPPNRVPVVATTALDFVTAENDDLNPLHALVTGLLQPVINTIEQYSQALDHDPLLCELTITMPPN